MITFTWAPGWDTKRLRKYLARGDEYVIGFKAPSNYIGEYRLNAAMRNDTPIERANGSRNSSYWDTQQKVPLVQACTSAAVHVARHPTNRFVNTAGLVYVVVMRAYVDHDAFSTLDRKWAGKSYRIVAVIDRTDEPKKKTWSAGRYRKLPAYTNTRTELLQMTGLVDREWLSPSSSKLVNE